MYVAKHFAPREADFAHRMMREHSFAALVTVDEAGAPCVSYLPFLLDLSAGEPGILLAHMARANPQWQHFSRPVLVSFRGPHAYLSPAWYDSRPNVPTWNYVAAQAKGRAEIVEDPAEVRSLLDRLVRTYEGPQPAWSMAEVDDRYLDGMQRGIVAFRVRIESVQASAKLSQNKQAADRLGAIAALQASADPQAREVAALMREVLS